MSSTSAQWFQQNAITRKIRYGRRRPSLSTNRFLFVLAQLDIERNTLTKFLKQPLSGLGGDAVYRQTDGRKDGWTDIQMDAGETPSEKPEELIIREP